MSTRVIKPPVGGAIYQITLFFVLAIHHQCEPQQIIFQDGAHNIDADEEKPVVFLTVSSLAAHPHIRERLLELNWHNIPTEIHENESSVRLYDHDPNTDNIDDFLVSINPHQYRDDEYYRTEIPFPRFIFSDNNITNECLGFWIAFVQCNEVLVSSCIKPFPYWMYGMRNVIGNASLQELMIPGTHNAASHAYYDPSDDTVFKRYLFTQDESILNQLVYGIRYLDLRVSYERVNTASERFWITHGVFRTDIPLMSVINEVKIFLNATREIVIMDFHRFVNGFTGRRSSTRHRSLISLLERELSDYMIPASLSSHVTLEELWQLNKRLYVGYASNAERKRSTYLFPAIRHLWGDKDEVQELFSYLNATVCRTHRRGLTSAMVQLTPTTAGAIFDVYGGLRKMAHDVNKHLSKWFQNLWWQCSNIVSTDFFLGNNMIQIAIEVNKKRFSSHMQLRTEANHQTEMPT